MTTPTEITMRTEDVLRVELEVFRHEHRDLDDAIAALIQIGTADQLTLKRLKKKKLAFLAPSMVTQMAIFKGKRK